MSGTSKKIIAFASVFLVATLVIIYIFFASNRVYVADGIIGNTAGNLNNRGLFCESDGYVYFANSYDDNSLYRMKPDQTEMERLYSMKVSYINAGGNYVFFHGQTNSVNSGLGVVVTKPGMYQISKTGKDFRTLTMEVSQNFLLVGNRIYLQQYNEQDGTTFSVMNLRNRKLTQLLDYMINPSCYLDGKFYYNGMYKDHYLYSYNAETQTEEVIWKGDCWNPIYDGSYVYYMDVSNNYHLCRYSIPNNTVEILSRERLDSFNLYGNIIYYQVSSYSEPALKRMRTDGSEVVTIAEGVYTDINITSEYTYFRAFEDERTTYFTKTFGAPSVKEFVAAKPTLSTSTK